MIYKKNSIYIDEKTWFKRFEINYWYLKLIRRKLKYRNRNKNIRFFKFLKKKVLDLIV